MVEINLEINIREFYIDTIRIYLNTINKELCDLNNFDDYQLEEINDYLLNTSTRILEMK